MVMVTVAVAVRLLFGLGVGLPLLVHIWGFAGTNRTAGRPLVCRASTSAEPVCPLKTMSGLFR